MTLIIGIKCRDGIVLGADSAATLGDALGQSTVVQSTNKINVIADRILIGVSGPVGLSQLFTDRLQQLHGGSGGSQLGQSTSLPAVMRLIRDAIGQDASIALRSAGAAAPVVGNAARLTAITGTLVALPVSDRPELIELDYQGNPEAATADLPYKCIGSGQPLADPFLAFIRKIFWSTDLPSWSEAVFSAVWALDHAIAVTTGGVAGPVRIAVVSGGSHKWAAKHLDEDQLQEHREHIASAESHLASFRDLDAKIPADEPPPPPSA